ncbi:hypothetical protein F4553_006638 [Allocatelliglobosispora scoriae]|uniref:Predicted membrane protein YciQ-like C-terminal domain-containing protein n=1 Tax=Allocatelliglobosispora scoriae TaxID=643052 RepID=A0A841BYI3_9ACTN|nr:DUF2207 domain-containing protein [Allocatelliglobosispora scoriae]MBB5873204.1 hypothetical protein [Allocatelliglobosispora scoriae]
MLSSLPPRLAALALVGGSVVLWLLATVIVKLIVRPPRRAPKPVPATPDLRDEPPAVVNLLLHRGTVTADAARATVLDLAARRILELHQPGNDPGQTTVSVRDQQPRGLLSFESRVLDRVKAAAGEGRVLLSELSRRHASEGVRWGKQFQHEVLKHAKHLGLVAKPLEEAGGPLVFLILFSGVLGCVAGTGVWGAVFGDQGGEPSNWSMIALLGTYAVVLLAFVVGGFAIVDGYRETKAGLAVIAHWSGVAAWLRGHEAFADLPPAGVTVWDRYLAHGVALGTNPRAGERIDLGVGREDLVWAVRDGHRRQVRVIYPRFVTRYGRRPTTIIVLSLLRIIICVAVLILLPPLPDVVRWTVVVIAAVIAAAALYRSVRALGDLISPVTVTGEVLSRSLVIAYQDVPARFVYLVVDDGRSDPLRAWIGRLSEISFSEAMAYGRSVQGGEAEEAMKVMPGRPTTLADCVPGMTVRLHGHAYARRIVDLEIV